MATDYRYNLPDCYIYLYHTDEYLIIPQYPESISDNMESNFSSQNALSRTSPVFAYNNSGPRTVQITLKLHRDMMNEVNKNNARIKINDASGIITNIDDDYVDILIKKLQSIALPRYESSSKNIEPPSVLLRLGEEILIRGVVTSSISVTYDLPLLSNNKYAQATVAFTISETAPYNADYVGIVGSFRGLTSGMQRKIDSIISN